MYLKKIGVFLAVAVLSVTAFFLPMQNVKKVSAQTGSYDIVAPYVPGTISNELGVLSMIRLDNNFAYQVTFILKIASIADINVFGAALISLFNNDNVVTHHFELSDIYGPVPVYDVPIVCTFIVPKRTVSHYLRITNYCAINATIMGGFNVVPIYDASTETIYNNGYAVGYDDGFDDGYIDGFDDGINDDNNNFYHWAEGHNEGYNEGIADTGEVVSFIPEMFGAVTEFFVETLGGVSLFGISLWDIIITLASVMLVVFFLKFII